MAATQQDPPILRLNHDILLHFLKMNADMFDDDNALKTTCITSQVCRPWRDFMLSTPSLWAKLIDLSMLDYGTTNEWRYELKERTGTALLWISARGAVPISDDSTGIISFFFGILGNDWNRIQKISLDSFDVSYMHPHLPQWNPLYLPAPSLQTFDVDFSGVGDLASDNVDKEYIDPPLFCHDAPMLREFYARELKFDFGAPWLQNLHLLFIDIETTIDEIFTILKATPCLRELTIGQAELGEIPLSLPTISLPDLSCLVLKVSFVRGVTLLNHLEFPPGCTMKIYPQATNGVDHTSEELCRVCMQTIARLARNLFRLYTPQKLRLHCSPHVLTFEDHTQSNRCFEFHISNHGNRASKLYMLTTFLKEFTLSEFSQVTEFRLDISVNLPMTIFSPFIACLSSVTVLYAPPKTFVYLSKFQDRLSKQADRRIVLFPLVQTVRLDYSAFTYSPGDLGALMEYLLSRIKDGCPISTLDLTKCKSNELPPVDFLEKVTGMMVLWKRWDVEDIFKYTCGSGDPARLRTFT